jgi:hypothetical protein
MIRSGVILAFCISFNISQMFVLAAAFSQENDNVRYVSDVLLINIKDHLEKPFEIVANVQSDDPVHIVEESGNYFKIMTADGKLGWIGKQYLKKDIPKTHIIKQLKQEVVDLKDQLASKSVSPRDTGGEKKLGSELICLELQQKLTDAEKYILKLLEEQKGQLHPISDSFSAPSGPIFDPAPGSSDQLELTQENCTLLLSEYEKRGKQIVDLQKNIASKDDHTRFIWFGAGAAVFCIGLLVGKTGNRKKNKLIY